MITAAQMRLYTLRFSGAPEEDFLAAFCPAGTMLTADENTFVLSNLRADQAGVLGIIRHLHNYGCILLELAVKNGESS